MTAMLPEAACGLILSHCASLRGSEVLPLDSCLGRVLAQDLISLVAHPPRRISAMDGYAVRASSARKDTSLRVVGQSRAGGAEVAELGEGQQAVQIFTGGALPRLADAILIDEHCDRADGSGADSIVVREAPEVGRYIRCAGADFPIGASLLQKNKLLSLRDVALAATMNHAWLSVRRKPVVAIVASGDELAHPGEARGDRQIAAANSLMLSLLVRSFGAQPRIVPFARDNLASLKTAFTEALQGSDLLVASGGASKSSADWVGAAVKGLGINELFSELAMRPGKPTRFGLAEGAGGTRAGGARADVPILVLPGNPASVYVGAMVFLRPMLRKLLSLPPMSPPATPLARYPLRNAIGKGGARSHYMRARIEDGQVEVFDDQESAHTLTLARANCLALQPAQASAKAKGEDIEVMVIDEV